MFDNILLNTDSYKGSHHLQYPPGAETVFSYVECRGTEFAELDYSTFFGLQAFLKQYLAGVQVTTKKIDEAEAFWKAHGFTDAWRRENWEYIRDVHGGKLPVEIRAVPEGTNVPLRNCLLTIENTDPKCFWLTCFLETALLRGVWYPTTVATLSNYVRRVIYKSLVESSDDPDGQIPFKLHDFGARGVSSNESAALGGMAHLVNFMGTDTIVGALAASKYYGAEMAGFSIPAAEHSTITSWGRENEVNAFDNMLTQFAKPGSLVAVVSDSYNIYDACKFLWGGALREKVLNSGATVVVRPDSGDPTMLPIEVLNRLGDAFGYTENSKGYKVLNPAVRVIQGDGMNVRSIQALITNTLGNGWSTENLAMGMGGGLLQKLDRDTLKWAMKCCAIQINGKWIDVYKEPVTDKVKVSKKGRLTLTRNLDTGEYNTSPYPLAHGHRCAADQLVPVFRNGELLVEYTFDEVRTQATTETATGTAV